MNEHRAAVVHFAQLASAGVLLQILQDSSERRRLIVGSVFFAHEVDVHLALLEHHLFDAEGACNASQANYSNQLEGFVRYAAETVFKALAEFHHVGFSFHVVKLLIEADAFAFLRDVIGRQHQLEVGVDNAVRHVCGVVVGVRCLAVAESVGKLFGGEFQHGFFEHFLIGFVAQVGNESALFGTEQVAGAAYVEVLHGNVNAAAQVGEAFDGLQATSRGGPERLAGRHEQIAERLA